MLEFFIGIIALNLFAIFMVLLRPLLFKTKLYRPMLKNIMLSIAPVVVLFVALGGAFALMMFSNYSRQQIYTIIGLIVSIVGLLIWLVLLPNAGYLITELNLNHRSVDIKEVPIWYDIIAVLSVSMSGVLNTIVNVMFIQMLYSLFVNPMDVTAVSFANNMGLWVLLIVIFLLVSFGIYIGRYIRFNSWDIIKPNRFIKKFMSHIKTSGNLKNMLLFVALYTVFFMIIYIIVIAPIAKSTIMWEAVQIFAFIN